MSSVSRVVKPPGGETSHNVFSWAEGNAAAASGSAAEPSSVGDHSSMSKPSSRPNHRALESHIVFGDADSEPNSRKSNSSSKQKELSGSGIFDSTPITVSSNAFASNQDQNNGNFITERPSVRLHQPAGGKSQISLAGDDSAPKKFVSPYKLKELQGTYMDDDKTKKNASDAKMKELYGCTSIFSPSEEAPAQIPTRSHSPGGATNFAFGEDSPPEPVARRVSDRKVQELAGRVGLEESGGDVDEERALGVVHATPMSEAKLKELQGCNIFSEGKLEVRDSVGGIRRPPGGESTISLV